MQHDEFIGQVRHRARLASRAEAERAVQATFETLAERMDAGAADNLAAQLPSGLSQHLEHGRSPGATGERFSLDEFFHRVSEREGVDQPQAVFHARVLEVTEEATSGALMTKVREQFPDEYDRVFDAGSTGRMAGES